MEIAFITSGVLPVPSVRGGAVETLLDALAQENEKSREPFTFTFFTVGDEKAKRVTESSKLKNTKYEYIKSEKTQICFSKGIFYMEMPLSAEEE